VTGSSRRGTSVRLFLVLLSTPDEDELTFAPAALRAVHMGYAPSVFYPKVRVALMLDVRPC